MPPPTARVRVSDCTTAVRMLRRSQAGTGGQPADRPPRSEAARLQLFIDDLHRPTWGPGGSSRREAARVQHLTEPDSALEPPALSRPSDAQWAA